jgi:monofunctional biosynthetic peptidoglycan transglycosylase
VVGPSHRDLTHHQDPYGSPIPEQLSKNLILWPSKNSFRKTLDAVLAEQLVHAISKQRVLELYLNEAQFGPNIYGVCDATWYYFDEPPDYMSLNDAYELMGVLPGPAHAHRLPTGGIDMSPRTPDGSFERYYIQGAQRWVPHDIRADGGSGNLSDDVTILDREMGITGTAHGQPNGPGDCRTMPQDIRQLIASEQQLCDSGDMMIIAGAILLGIGVLTNAGIVWTIGCVVLLTGLIALLMGATGHGISGRRHYF